MNFGNENLETKGDVKNTKMGEKLEKLMKHNETVSNIEEKPADT